MKEKNSILIKLFLSLLIITSSITAKSQVKILAGQGGINVKIANDIKSITDADIDDSKSLFSIEDLNPGQVTFIQRDVLQRASFMDILNPTGKIENVRVLLPIGSKQIHIIIKIDGKRAIKSFVDLKQAGVKIAVGPKGQGTAITASIIKELTEAQWEESYNPNLGAAITKLFKDEVDAIIYVGTAPVEGLKIFSRIPAYEQSKIRLLPLTEVALNDTYVKGKINKGVYKWVKDYEVETFDVPSFLITTINEETSIHRSNLGKMLDDIKSNIIKLQQKDNGYQTQIWKQVNFGYANVDWKKHDEAIVRFIETGKKTEKKEKPDNQ